MSATETMLPKEGSEPYVCWLVWVGDRIVRVFGNEAPARKFAAEHGYTVSGHRIA